jgi:ferredoxin--NADP+ reductase
MTDDGSWGERGFTTDKLRALLEAGERYDQVTAIGPPMMMKLVCDPTTPYGVKTVVSLNPIMIDGTGMCGCCRLTVGGKTKFACVDGPDFDGHQVDFAEALARSRMFHREEAAIIEHHCRLTGGAK